jgi:YD repeat-containing protein
VVKAVSNRTKLNILVLGCAVLLATSAFAANKASFRLMQPTDVAGKQLPAGDYNVQWDGSGNSVQVNITQGKKQVASTTAKVVQMQKPASDSNALINTTPDGGRSLAQLRFRGKTFALDLTGEGAGAASGGAGR